MQRQFRKYRQFRIICYIWVGSIVRPHQGRPHRRPLHADPFTYATPLVLTPAVFERRSPACHLTKHHSSWNEGATKGNDEKPYNQYKQSSISKWVDSCSINVKVSSSKSDMQSGNESKNISTDSPETFSSSNFLALSETLILYYRLFCHVCLQGSRFKLARTIIKSR